MNIMEQCWQATCANVAVDGCHIPIKSPDGRGEARK